MHLAIEQQHNHAATSLVLIGDLDVATASGLAERLCALRSERAAVHIDLSKVEFIDGFGAGVLRAAVRDADRHRWQLQIEPYMRRQVRRVLDQIGLALPHAEPEVDALGGGAR